MGRYDDVLRFLEMNENRNDAGLNERILLNAEETDEIRKEHPDIPNDYIDYLTEVGWGDFRESQYMVYSCLVDSEEIFGAEICEARVSGLHI
jgi:hypothetical protein